MLEPTLVIISVILPVWCIVMYNLLVRDKNRVLAAWSDISVQLKRRHDLIPKLVDAVNAYTRYEKTVLDDITRLRSRADLKESPAKKGRIEELLTNRVADIIAVAEDYPDLKASTEFLELMNQLTDVENHIQYARRYYNGAVRNLNIRIDSFPDLLIARFFNFIPAEFFEFDASLKQ